VYFSGTLAAFSPKNRRTQAAKTSHLVRREPEKASRDPMALFYQAGKSSSAQSGPISSRRYERPARRT
jgi:hypothetical protein